MLLLKTIDYYLIKLYSKYFFIVSLIMLCVLLLCSSFEHLYKFKDTSIVFSDFIKLIILKTPYLFNEIFVIIFFISTIFFLRKLLLDNILVIVLSSGIGFTRIFNILVFFSLFLCILLVSTLNPIGSYFLNKYKFLSYSIKNNNSKIFFINKNFLISNADKGIISILNVNSVELDINKLNNITIFTINNEDMLLEKLEANYGFIKNKILDMYQVRIVHQNQKNYFDHLTINTLLNIEDIFISNINPEYVSVWKLRNLIKYLNTVALSSKKYEIYYYKQLFKPILTIGYIGIACCLYNNNMTRYNSNSKIKLFYTIILCIVTQLSLDLLSNLLIFYNVTPIFSVLLPILFIVFISYFIILCCY